MADDASFSLIMRRVEDFEFEVRFDREHFELLLLDEPEPIGHDKGPNAARLLGAAVGNCLSASLLFCLRKSRVELRGMQTEVRGFLERNEKGRLRVIRLDVDVTLDLPGEDPNRIARCISIFEDYCIVTGSVRKAIEVRIKVVDQSGTVLLEQGPTGQAPASEP